MYLDQKRSFGKILLLVLSLAGAVLCILNAAGADLFCVTQGCRIYQSYSFLGISFYGYGLAGFLAVFVLALLYPRGPSAYGLSAVLSGAVLLDALFLAYQYLFWPCVSCLVAGLLIGLLALCGASLLRLPGRRVIAGLLLLWLVFFSYVGLAALKETTLRPWAVEGDAQAPIQIYFSPVCPACREVVGRILDDPAVAPQAAFFPVAKNVRDERRLAAFLRLRENEGDAALSLIFEGGGPGEEYELSAEEKRGLARNKMMLARMGVSTVPVIITPYLPQGSPRAFPALSAPRRLDPQDSPFVPPDILFAPTGGAPFAPPDLGCPAFEVDAECEEEGI